MTWEWDAHDKQETKRVQFTSDTKKGQKPVKKRKPKKSKKKKEQVMDLEEARRRQIIEEKSFTVSPYTLRLGDPKMDEEYTQYQRKEALRRVRYLLYIFTIFSLLVLIRLIMNDSEEDLPVLQLFLPITALPTIMLAIAYVLSLKYLWCAELLGPAVFGSLALVIIVVNLQDSLVVSQSSRNALTFMCTIFQIFYAGLFNCGFLRHFIIRTVMLLTAQVILQYRRVELEEAPLMQLLTLLVGNWIVLEIIFFVQAKSNARLFLSNKVTQFQQNQLFNLLDSVPDKVLICSRNTEEMTPKATYSNRQMREFLGSDPVIPDKPASEDSNKSADASKVDQQ